MPYTYSIEGRTVVVAWSGTITTEDLVSLEQKMPQIGRSLGFAPDALHTFGGVIGAEYAPAAAYAYSRRQQQVAIPNPIRAAMVVVTKENEYLATVFATLNRAPNLEMRIFYDEESARRWLARE